MTLSIIRLQQYADLLNDRILSYRIAADYQSATFVLESGKKLTMTEAALAEVIEDIQRANKTENPKIALAAMSKIKKGEK